MRTRLREESTADYQVVRDNFYWSEHAYRLFQTAAAIAWLAPEIVLDPACGDGTVVEYAHRLWPLKNAYLYDISVPQIQSLRDDVPGVRGVGDAFDVLAAERQTVDVVVLTEILEHVVDPDRLLWLARRAGKHLVASSPLNETLKENNHEHLWSWDKDGYEQMLKKARWKPIAYTELGSKPYFYTFQLWVCE